MSAGMWPGLSALGISVAGVVLASNTLAQDPNSGPSESKAVELDTVTVTGRGEDLVGIAASASQGRVGQAQIERRPILRNGEILEVIPGLLATQHSGTGKANQYFLRGFNLDHGTDFSLAADGVPFNLPTHGHGQGYLDVNSIIPELVEVVEFGKGPYYAEIGDFSSAGYSRIKTYDRLEQGIVKGTIGQDNYLRGLIADSRVIGRGDLLYALEAVTYDGPWDVPEDLEKLNGQLKYTRGDLDRGLTGFATAYRSQWNSTDQIPLRAVEDGWIDRLGTVDDTNGGESERYTLGLNWWDNRRAGASRINASLSYYSLDLYSNFTFFLDNPVDGDQIYQKDRRRVTYVEAENSWFHGQDRSETSLGVQLRNDDIDPVALFRTSERETLSTVRQDEVRQTSVGLYARNETRWTDKLRSVLGLRGDFYEFEVDSDTPENSGSSDDAIVSPKASLIFGPWNRTEYYVNAGYGFHSNDARGTTITVDPETGDPLSPVDPLVRSKGAEVGLRSEGVRGWVTTVALWYLELDSELLFVGDAGTTEPSGASERYGIEWSNFYQPRRDLSIDLDIALTQSQYDNGDDVPGSVGRVVSGGITKDWPGGYYGSLRLRHFADVPLTEDGSVEADPTTLWNLKAGWQRRRFGIELDVLNLFDSDDADISYYYASRLPGEPAGGIEDIHFHPVEPRTIRITGFVRF